MEGTSSPQSARENTWILPFAPLLAFRVEKRGSHLPRGAHSVSIRLPSPEDTSLLDQSKQTLDPTVRNEILSDNSKHHTNTTLDLPSAYVPLVAMSATFKHAALGELEGNKVDGSIQFLGLKYASIKDRFAPPELVSDYGSGSTDATKFGFVNRLSLAYNKH